MILRRLGLCVVLLLTLSLDSQADIASVPINADTGLVNGYGFFDGSTFIERFLIADRGTYLEVIVKNDLGEVQFTVAAPWVSQGPLQAAFVRDGRIETLEFPVDFSTLIHTVYESAAGPGVSTTMTPSG